MSAQTINEFVWDLLGFSRKKKPRASDIIEVIRSGLPARSVQDFSEALNLPIRELSTYIHVSSRTLERRLKDNRALDVDASDRLVELAKVYGRASEVMEGNERARRWLFESSRVLGNVTPVSLLDTSSGIELVLDELGRIEHGIAV
jgi:putative toxin-antitoxin system antitoxin component (TIGR02293 family)